MKASFVPYALLLVMTVAALGSLPVAAAWAVTGANTPSVSAYCASHPETCADGAAKVRERCAEDPAACEKARDRLQALKAKCDADPAACERKKQELRERFNKFRHRDKVPPAGDTPPTIPPKPDR